MIKTETLWKKKNVLFHFFLYGNIWPEIRTFKLLMFTSEFLFIVYETGIASVNLPETPERNQTSSPKVAESHKCCLLDKSCYIIPTCKELLSFPTIITRPEERDGRILLISLEKNHRKGYFRPLLTLSARYHYWCKHPWKLEWEVQHQFQYKIQEVNNGNHSSCLSWKELPLTGR